MPKNLDPEYQYSPDEILTILKGRLEQRAQQQQFRAVPSSSIFVVDAFEGSPDLDRIFSTAVNNLNTSPDHNMLIVYKIHKQHWLGIHVEFAKAKIAKATFIGSLPDNGDESTLAHEKQHIIRVSKYIRNRFRDPFVFVHQMAVILNKPSDSIICAIENLIYSVLKFRVRNPDAPIALRMRYEVILQTARQFQPFVDEPASSTLQELPADSLVTQVTKVEEDVNEFFTTLTLLNLQVRGYLGLNERPFNSQISKTLREQFETVFDHRTGKLTLQLKGGVERTLGAKQILEMELPKRTPSSLLSHHRGMTAKGAVYGIAVGKIVGVCINAAVKRANPLVFIPTVFAAENAFQGILLVLRALVAPETLIFVAVGGVAGGAWYAYKSHLYYSAVKIIQDANMAYYQCANTDDERLTTALSTLDDIHKYTGDKELMLLAKLIRAFIHIKRGKPDQLQVLDDIINKTSNEELRALCLIGKILFYSQPEKLRLDKPLSIEDRFNRLDDLSRELSEKHPDMVMCYFAAVIKAYEGMYSAVETKTFQEDAVKFEPDRQKITHLSYMPDLACLRFMGDRGPMAEIAFVYMQGMGHRACELHYATALSKEGRQDKQDELTISLGSAKDAAKERFDEVLRLIDQHGYKHDRTDESRNQILDNMVRYIDIFSREYAEYLAKRSGNHNAARAQTQFSMQQYRNFLSTQPGYLENTFQDSPEAFVSHDGHESVASTFARMTRGGW